jgi:hypothetical protein
MATPVLRRREEAPLDAADPTVLRRREEAPLDAADPTARIKPFSAE